MTSITSHDRIIVLVGGVLCILAVAFLFYRVCKRFFHRRFSAQDNIQRPDTNSVPRPSRLESILTRRPQLIVPTETDLRVGDTAQFKITLPEPYRFQPPIPESVPMSQPHPTANALTMNNDITIDVKKIAGTPETIRFLRELSFDPVTNEDSITVKYTVREIGFYEITVLYQNSHVAQSPQLQGFLPAVIDPGSTVLIKHAPTIVTFTGSPQTLTILPKDRFGNICHPDNFTVADFDFKVTEMHQSQSSLEIPFVYKFTSENTDDWGDVQVNVRLTYEIFRSGVFRGVVCYQGISISHATFDLVCLTPAENDLLTTVLKTPPESSFFKGKLFGTNAEVHKSPSDIFIYIGSKGIIVKQYFFLNLLPYRLGFYRILPITKMELSSRSETEYSTTFTICDRNQPKLTIQMESSHFRVLMATFAHYLQQRLGGSESFENKQKLFYSELRLAREDKNRDFVMVKVQRWDLVESAMAITRYFGTKDWCRKFRVEFEGEEGFDDGGLRRELSTLLCDHLFQNNPSGLFCSMGTSRLVHPNPKRSRTWTLRHYEFAGKLVGKCMFESSIGGFSQQMVNGRFSRSFLAHVIGSFPQPKNFEQDDPELYLGKVKFILENDVSSMDLLFEEEEYDENGTLRKTVDLIPTRKGLQVTNDNKEEYVSALAQYRLGTRVQAEIDAFLKGLHLIVPEGLLSSFDENELEILMCGKSTFDIEDLKRHHFVTDSGMGPALVSKILQWFWSSVEGMSVEERGRLLQFTTGSSLLPIGSFKELRPTFRITVSSTVGKLPVAHTCFSEICLSNHNTFEDFNKSLLTAVNECSEGYAMM